MAPNAKRDKPSPLPLPAAYPTAATSPSSRSHHSISTSSSDSPRPPPWEVLALVPHHMDDAKTLAMASCVSKSWQAAASSDRLWRPITTASFPSLTVALKTLHPSLPYRHLYALAHSAAASHRRRKPLPKPSISLDDLVFSIDLRDQDDETVLVSMAGLPGEVATVDPTGVFGFNIVAACGGALDGIEAETEVRVTWHVMLRDAAPFKLMDAVVRVRQEAGGTVVGFSEELPSPGCCPSGGMSGMSADLKMEFGEYCRRGDHGNKNVVKVEKVSLGLLSTVNCRYVSVEDGLRYLQHFLLQKT